MLGSPSCLQSLEILQNQLAHFRMSLGNSTSKETHGKKERGGSFSPFYSFGLRGRWLENRRTGLRCNYSPQSVELAYEPAFFIAAD